MATAVFSAGCDVGGHYSRSDILRLVIDRRPLERISAITSYTPPDTIQTIPISRPEPATVRQHLLT